MNVMTGKENEDSKRGIHDFFNERPYMLAAIGFLPSKSFLINAYRVWIFFIFFYLEAVSGYSIYLNRDEKVTMLNSVHTFLMPSFGITGLIFRLCTHRSLARAIEIVRTGIYEYEPDDFDEEQRKMRENIVPEVKRKTFLVVLIFVVGTVWNMVLFPLSQLLVVEEEDRDHSQDNVNPYLPQVMYTPFSTRNVLGYSAAYLMSVVLFIYVYGVVLSMNEIFVSCIVQLRVHLQILNHSIRNIQKRAFIKYSRGSEIQRETSIDDLYKTQEYQNCLYSCLRANIQHHQALLKFRKEWETFGGATLLAQLTVGCFVNASFIYLSFQFDKLPINLSASYIVTLLAELAFPYCNCFFGEQVIAESTTMFEELYGIPWMYYNKRFNQALAIIMTRSVEPMKIHCLLLSGSASLDTFGDLITAAYKAANLVRQSDKH